MVRSPVPTVTGEPISAWEAHRIGLVEQLVSAKRLRPAAMELAQTIAAKRLGRPEEVGDMCAFLCSAQAGYVSGQSIQLDGGSFDGLL